MNETKLEIHCILITHVNAVIKSAMLCDSDEARRVIRIGVDRTEAIGTCGETSCDWLSYDAIYCCTVHSFEKCESVGVLGCGRSEGGD